MMKPEDISISNLSPHLAPAVKAVAAAAAQRKPGVLLVGPGVGMIMLAQRVPLMLPPLSPDALRYVRNVQFRAYASAGLTDYDHPHGPERPFRAPHHTISDLGLADRTHGEVMLAVGGVLMLDELLEFRTTVLQALVTRIAAMDVACRPFLVATAPPCPCGGPRGVRNCVCPRSAIDALNAKRAALGKMLKLTRVDMPERA